MLDFYEKRKIRTILYSKPVLILLAAVIAMLSYSVWGVYIKERETLAKKNQRAAVLEELVEREQILEEEINRLNTARGIDEELRSKFEVAKDGEKVIVIVDGKEQDETERTTEKKSLFERIKNIFQ
jgi:cell division protein FtsB